MSRGASAGRAAASRSTLRAVKQALPIAASCMYFEASARLASAAETGAITLDEYQVRAGALRTWLDERNLSPWPHRQCGYVFVPNPRLHGSG